MIPWRWIFAAILLFGAWQHWHTRPVKVPAGSIAPQDPVQTLVAEGKIHRHENYDLHVLADFSLEARVLAKERYQTGREADLSPYDLALGWGAMSDSTVLEKLAITQSGRFYFYRWENDPPRPPAEIASHSANMHLIPTSPALEKIMKNVRVGQVVRISGQLIEARAPDGWRWRSSLTREDTGAGACEVVRVESISIR